MLGRVISSTDRAVPGLKPGRDRIVFLDQTLYSHSASLHPKVQKGTAELFKGRSDRMLRSNWMTDKHSTLGE